MRPLVTPAARYCTAIDVAFVPHWLALHRSMTRHGAAAGFLVCCWDDEAKTEIDSLGIPDVVAIPLAELEEADRGLAAVRGTRSFREYRSTAKPSLCRHALDADPGADVVVYLDVDLMFFGDPGDLVGELGDDSILLVPQRHPPSRRWQEDVFGRYQAGSVAFRRGPEADEALAWWRARCLEWCSHEPEPGRWADQRYLQDWPERFRGVRVSDHPGIGPAPWNAAAHRFDGDGARVLVDDRPLVFYHYSGLAQAGGRPALLRALSVVPGLYRSGSLLWGHPWYRVPRPERALVWDPYVRELGAATAAIGRRAPRSALAMFAEIVLRRRLLWAAMWGVRRALVRGRRAASGGRAERLLGSTLGALDRLRRRWRVE
jgi:hypothetical protein